MDIPNWLLVLVLVLKPVAVLVIAFAYYWFVYRLCKWMEKRLPDHPVTHELFRERGDGGRVRRPGDPKQRALQ